MAANEKRVLVAEDDLTTRRAWSELISSWGYKVSAAADGEEALEIARTFEPHIILSGKDDGGRPMVIEILRWRDADAPDDVSKKYPSVRAIWDRLNALVEKRDGKPAIDIEEMEIVSRGNGGPR